MPGRIRETEAGTSFVAECDCLGEWQPLEVVTGALEGFATWNANHATAGHSLECRECRTVYVLGGRLTGEGLPDLLEAGELGEIARLELTELQRRLLDVSLIAEETLWAKAMGEVKLATKAGDHDRARGHWLAARLMRGAHRREKRRTILAILREHGVGGVDPTALRIARTPDGLGAIYNVTRGELPMPKKELEPESLRSVDLSDWTSKHDDEDAELAQVFVRVLDLS